MSTQARPIAFPQPPHHAAPAPAGPSEVLQLLVGPSPAAAHLWAQVRRVAPHFRTALLTGEEATGSEAVARAMHDLSPASWRPFLALSAADAEQYFPHRTFVAAPSEGTLYLSDVTRLSRAAQTGLLRVLRHRGNTAVRVVAFARNGLRAAVSTGAFANELASALAAVRIGLPSLRERPEDIPLLASHLLQRRAQALGKTAPAIAPGFLEAAARYNWPGNLDQLRSVLDALLEDAGAGALTSAALEAAIKATSEPADKAPEMRMVKLDQVIQEHIRAVLFGCNGNKLRAAEILGISRSTLYRMLDAASPSSISLPLAG